MIGRRHAVTYAPRLEELRPYRGSELASAVSGDGFWDAESADPAVCESVDNRVGIDVLQGDGGLAREAVDHCK